MGFIHEIKVLSLLREYIIFLDSDDNLEPAA